MANDEEKTGQIITSFRGRGSDSEKSTEGGSESDRVPEDAESMPARSQDNLVGGSSSSLTSKGSVARAMALRGTASGSSPRMSGVDKRKLAVMPLSVLLPPIGDVSHLGMYRDTILQRYQELWEQRTSGGEEASKEQLREESMLNQIIQWLTMGSEEAS